jgi:hypothetical protein
MVREPDATMQPTPQDNQLMSKHRVLSFKPHLRLEWRGQDGQNETEQPDHSASLVDSITSSTRIRFSVHTGMAPRFLTILTGRDLPKIQQPRELEPSIKDSVAEAGMTEEDLREMVRNSKVLLEINSVPSAVVSCTHAISDLDRDFYWLHDRWTYSRALG